MLWAGLVLASLLGGFVKGATGFGGALILAPCFVPLVGARESAVLVVLIHALTCLQGVRAWHAVVRLRPVCALAAIAVASTALFSRLLDLTDAAAAKRIAGCLVIALPLLRLSGWRWKHRAGVFPVLLAGLVSGACTAAAGAGGPPAVMYFSGQAQSGEDRLRETGSGETGKEEIRGNLLAFFVLLFTLSAATLAWQGKVGSAVMLRSLVLAPLFYLGGLGGERLFLRIGNQHFGRLVTGLLILSGVAMLLL